MPVLTTFEIVGDADAILADKVQKLDPISRELAPKHGALAHMVLKTDRGIKILNVWETLQGSEDMAREFGERARALGIDRKPENWESWNLEQFVSMKEVLPTVGV